MKGLDTNVLVRYLTQDDAAQSRKANALIAETVAGGDRCFISAVVLCEMVWVLRGAYGLEKGSVVSALEKILGTAQFGIEAKDVVRRALEDYRRGRGDFADYLIGRRNRESGCAVTATFDRKLADSELFQVL